MGTLRGETGDIACQKAKPNAHRGARMLIYYTALQKISCYRKILKMNHLQPPSHLLFPHWHPICPQRILDLPSFTCPQREHPKWLGVWRVFILKALATSPLSAWHQTAQSVLWKDCEMRMEAVTSGVHRWRPQFDGTGSFFCWLPKQIVIWLVYWDPAWLTTEALWTPVTFRARPRLGRRHRQSLPTDTSELSLTVKVRTKDNDWSMGKNCGQRGKWQLPWKRKSTPAHPPPPSKPITSAPPAVSASSGMSL